MHALQVNARNNVEATQQIAMVSKDEKREDFVSFLLIAPEQVGTSGIRCHSPVGLCCFRSGKSSSPAVVVELRHSPNRLCARSLPVYCITALQCLRLQGTDTAHETSPRDHNLFCLLVSIRLSASKALPSAMRFSSN